MARSTVGLIGCVLISLSPSVCAGGQAVFVNLSDEDVYLAKAVYQAATAGQGDGWRFSGWWKIPGGGVVRQEPGFFYLNNKASQVKWDNREESGGLISGDKFDRFVPTGSIGRDPPEGYRFATFQKMDDGIWNISGNAYKLNKQTIPFEFKSEVQKPHDKDYTMAGTVYGFELSGEESKRASKVSWEPRGDKLHAHVGTGQLGVDVYPDLPGFYRGKVTVYYVERK